MIITALFFNALLRTLVLSLLSVFLTYGTRNGNIKKRITVSCIYLACVVVGLAWVFFFISIWSESPDMEVLFWGTAWSCFFLIITVIQHFVYKVFGEEKDIGLLILNALVVFILSGIALNYIK